jgi:ribosomal protein L34E
VFALGDGTVITIRRQCMTSRRVLQLESAPQGSAVKLYNNKKHEKSNCHASTTSLGDCNRPAERHIIRVGVSCQLEE